MDEQRGTIYVLTNPVMSGVIKIGKIDVGIQPRLKQLYMASIPIPYECYYDKRIAFYHNVERKIHAIFDDVRINPKREFFPLDPEKVRLLLDLLEGDKVADDEEPYASLANSVPVSGHITEKRWALLEKKTSTVKELYLPTHY